MIKVSIVVPVYNTDKYLKKCLDSLVNQTLSDIEIICVNDGSTDDSLSIVNDYANKDNRIKVISQTNQKQGAARNRGSQLATGEYIGFVDSDDWVDLNYFENLYNAAKNYDLDIALATNVRIGGKKTKKRLNIIKEDVYKTLQEKFDVCNQFKNECPTNKIYRRLMLQKYNIVWPEGSYCEDKLFTTQAVYYADGIVTVPNTYYYYYRNPSSTVNSKAKHHLKKVLEDKNKARQSVLHFLKSKHANIRDKEYWAVKKEYIIFRIPVLKIKESLYSEKYYLFSFVKIWEKSFIK